MAASLPKIAGAKSSGPLSLRANFSWTLAGNLVYAACQWAMLVVLARSTSPAVVGQFSVALALTAPIVLFTNLKLRAVQVTDARGENTFEQFFALRLASLPVAIAVVSILVLALGYDRDLAIIVLLVAISKCVEGISDIIYGLFQAREKMDLIAFSMGLKGALSLGVFSCLVYLTGSLVTSLIGLVAAWSVVLLAFDIPNTRKEITSGRTKACVVPRFCRRYFGFRPDWNWSALWKMTILALPLAGTTMLGSLSSAIPRLVLERGASATSVGLFSSMAYVLVAGGLVINALGQSASPRLARMYASAQFAGFLSLLLRLIILGAGLGAAGVIFVAIFGKWLLGAVYGKEYAEESTVFTWIMLQAAISYVYVFVGTGLSAMRRFNVQLPIHLASVGVLTVSCISTVGHFGIEGVVWSMIGSSAFEVVAYIAVFTRIQTKLSNPYAEVERGTS